MSLRIKFGIVGVCICLLLGLTAAVVISTDVGKLLPDWFAGEDIFQVFLLPLFLSIFSLMGAEPGNTSLAIRAGAIGVILTLILYFILGYILGLIYEKIRDHISGKTAVLAAIVILLIAPAGLVYSKYYEYKKFFHVGETPADCAKLQPDQQQWCYRNIYRKYSIPEVCVHLRGGEDEECAKRYGAQSGSLASCLVFNNRELNNYCRWGVAFANKDLSLCYQLPDDDGNPYNLSTQKSCVEVISNYWEQNKDFYFNPTDWR